MKPVDTWWLGGAAALMAATAGLSLWSMAKPSSGDRATGDTPEVGGLRFPSTEPPERPSRAIDQVRQVWCGVLPEPRPAPEWAAYLHTRYIGVPVDPPPSDVRVLPAPVLGPARSDLDGTTITWTLRPREVKLFPWMKRREALPEGFVVKRSQGGGPAQTIATLGPQARSFRDPSTEPLSTYEYQVELFGKESDLSQDPPALRAVTLPSVAPAGARSPSATRIRLVGGDRTTALWRVEVYDRSRQAWTSRTVLSGASGPIGQTRFTLKRLWFDRSTLTAEVSDESDQTLILTPKD